jgi:hypothetical protein
MTRYYKIIDGRTVISYCQSIKMPDGSWVSNPSTAQIEAAGWQVYVEPPTPPAPPRTEPYTEEMVDAVKKLLLAQTESLDDVTALEVATLFPAWAEQMGRVVLVGQRYWYDGKLYKVIQEHTCQSDWTPDVSVSLFVEVSVEEWPQWRQPTGAQDAYMTGDKVTFEGTHYVSLIDNNTWSPAEYPAGWEARP